MKIPAISEFAQYRFVRDARGNVINLPSQGVDERILLVLDCERWGLARLHIFEGAAARKDKLEAFQAELQQIAEIRSDHVSRLVSWGRDAEELFYADEMQDGEPLTTYLGRTGRVPVPVASEWILQLLTCFESLDRLPPSLERFSTLNFEVVMNRQGRIFPVFSEFYGWTKPGAQVREHKVDWSFAQIFCSLVAGVPIRTFHRDSLPRNFDELDESTREVILRTLEEGSAETYDAFKAAMEAGSAGAKERESAVAVPLMPVREWIRNDLANSYEGPADYVLNADFARDDERYSILSHLRGAAANIQLIPGPGSIPREGWLNQHHDATRRPGRGMMNQLSVNYVEDRDSLTLIGEERVEGVDLNAIVTGTGPLSAEVVKRIASAINAALDGLEKQAGACAVWWLPPENVFLLTGTRSLGGSIGLIERKGPEAWSSLPLKLRLHQTLATLKDGVNLPTKVRQLSRLPGKQYEAVRRSAIALPLLYYCLTGNSFCWSDAVKTQSAVEGPFGELFDYFRIRLREEPSEMVENLFLAFVRLDLSPENDIVVAVPEEPLREDDTSLAEVLKATLYDGEIDITDNGAVSVVEEIEALQSTAEGYHEVETVGPVVPVKRALSSVWLWAAVTGVVLASVVGYSLSGWSFTRGVFKRGEPLAFPLPEFRLVEGDPAALARSTTEDLLVAAGTPESLALLPLLQDFDLEANREKITAWVEGEAGRGNGAAHRALGLISLSKAELAGSAAGHFLEGARKGDLESRFSYAVSQWKGEGGGSLGSEALSILEMAASSGHPAGQELLAMVKAAAGDPAGAFKWMELSASKGRPSAIYQLGLYFMNGVGCEADVSQAVTHLRSAAELGDERAMYDYGRCLSEGTGTPASFTEAQRWMRIASSRGHGGALRWCLDRGIDLSDGNPQ